MTRYIAFLRGINLGKRQVKMDDLQKVFIDLGFSEVKTLIASGNVIFSTTEKNEETLRKMLEEKLENSFGFFILTILRNMTEIENLVEKNPFGNTATNSSSSRNEGSKLRFNITLFAENIKSNNSIKKGDYEIMVIGKRELASIVYPKGKTTDLMTFIDKTYGKNSTTRNWNTIQKLLL